MYSSSVKMALAMTLLFVGLVAGLNDPCFPIPASVSATCTNHFSCDKNGWLCWAATYYGSGSGNYIQDKACSRYATWINKCVIFYNNTANNNIKMPIDADFNMFGVDGTQNNLNITLCGTYLSYGRRSIGDADESRTFNSRITSATPTPSPSPSPVSLNVDWTTSGGVLAVRNQGNLSSCWAHATVAHMEFLQWKVTNGSNTAQLSTKQLTDCTYPFGNQYGPNAFGAPNNVFEFFLHNDMFFMANLLMRPLYNSAYNENTPGYGCRLNLVSTSSMSNLVITDYTAAWVNGNETTMATLARQGVPVSTYRADALFKTYTGGLYTNDVYISSTWATSDKQVNHAMAMVGVTQSPALSYFLVKNSFGTSWGLNGYARLAHNGNNIGGVANWAFFADAKWITTPSPSVTPGGR